MLNWSLNFKLKPMLSILFSLGATRGLIIAQLIPLDNDNDNSLFSYHALYSVEKILQIILNKQIQIFTHTHRKLNLEVELFLITFTNVEILFKA
jgi:hypothetical protein